MKTKSALALLGIIVLFFTVSLVLFLQSDFVYSVLEVLL